MAIPRIATNIRSVISHPTEHKVHWVIDPRQVPKGTPRTLDTQGTVKETRKRKKNVALVRERTQSMAAILDDSVRFVFGGNEPLNEK